MHQNTSPQLLQLTAQVEMVREGNELVIPYVAHLYPCEITPLVFMAGLTHLFSAPPAYHAQEAAASPIPTAHLLMACFGCSGQTGGKHSQSIPFFLLHSHSTLFHSIFKCSSYLTSSILHLTFAQNHLLLHAAACIGKGRGLYSTEEGQTFTCIVKTSEY